MKNVNATLIIVILLLLLSCSGNSSRISLLEETTGLSLPKQYQELKNETEESGAFGSDFTVTIELKLDEQGMQQIIHQIQKVSPVGTKAGNSGKWQKFNTGYSFIKDNENEITEATVKVQERTIQYRFTHL